MEDACSNDRQHSLPDKPHDDDWQDEDKNMQISKIWMSLSGFNTETVSDKLSLIIITGSNLAQCTLKWAAALRRGIWQNLAQ